MRPIHTYITKDVDNLTFDLSKSYSSIKFIDCSEFTGKDFFNSLSSNPLLVSNKVRCYTNVNTLKVSEVLHEIEGYEGDFIILIFYSLAKNTKLYKFLQPTIKPYKGIDNKKNKLAFIKDSLKKAGVSSISQQKLVDVVPSSKRFILNEVHKLAAAEAAGIPIEDVMSSSELNKSVMDFISALFTDPYKALDCIPTVASTCTREQIKAIILKKLLSYIYICLDDIPKSKQCWNTSRFYIQQEIATAKSFSLYFLFKLYSYCDDTFSYFNIKSLDNILTSVVYRIYFSPIK